MEELVKSISYSQEEILKNIINLYNSGNAFDVDPCYSKGVFYKNIEKPKYCFDIEPKYEFVQKYDCRELPFSDNTINSIIFDPPFLATTGKSLNMDENNNIINKRFSVYERERELFQFYWDSIDEFVRVLNSDGLLVIKCQDKVSSDKQYLSHVAIINYCESVGLYCEDMFVLLAKSRLVADWQVKNQKRSRKFHSYFLVFRKGKKTKINRIHEDFGYPKLIGKVTQ